MKKSILLVALVCLTAAAFGAPHRTLSGNYGSTHPDVVGGVLHLTTADNPVHLDGQVFIEAPVSLVIDPGVVIASYVEDSAGNEVGGSLAIQRGAKIYVNGTKNNPVIMTSAEDVATWTGTTGVLTNGNGYVYEFDQMGDPKSGTWREGVTEWGNLTVMGNAYISAYSYGGVPVGTNVAYPDAGNEKPMEGFAPGVASEVMYGGGDDCDDSGSITYLSIRYGGEVAALNSELNGMSLGGIGRETDIHHVEIMNNVDDGIEIWGGTVQLEYINIWNIGDDSLDVDQGWRGSAKHGLIVQGYSTDAGQGSGVGDNCIETDGAENSDGQPMTTIRVENFTVVGQPDGDGGTAWRDNARVQYSKMLFCDMGEKLVRFDGDDGDGQSGYGWNGTLSWADHWTTSYSDWYNDTTVSNINLNASNTHDIDTLNAIYGCFLTQEPQAPLCSITKSVICNSDSSVYDTDYDEAIALGVVADSGDGSTPVLNKLNDKANVVTEDGLCIQQLTRAAQVDRGGKDMRLVTFINPMPTSWALGCTSASCDTFGSDYRGGFAPGDNWLAGWTAVDAYGMTDTSMNALDADIDNDGDVDLGDFGILSGEWLQ